MLINRLLCVLQPFKDLWAGNAKPNNSISSTYTSIPPQFVVWRAIKSRHFVLSLVCSAVFLSNVLTVSLPAIFKEVDMSAKYAVNFTSQVSNTFKNESVVDLLWHLSNDSVSSAAYQDHTYAALANITSGTTLPPWVTSDFYFQPWDNTDRSNDSVADFYTLVTRGFGVEPNCTSVPAPTFAVDERAEFSPNVNKTFCGDFLAVAATHMRETEAETRRGRSAQEYCSTPTYGRVAGCDRTLILGWARTPNAKKVNGTIEGSFAICRPIFQTAMFEVQADKAGYIRSYKRMSPLEQRLEYTDSEIHIEQMIANANNILAVGALGWHNDTVSRDWVNHLLLEVRGSREILDPKEPPPNPDDLIQYIDTIYRQLFSLLLVFQKSYLFEASGADQTIEAKRSVTETRLFLDEPAFIISMVLLGFNIAAAALFYSRGVVFVLPRMPTSLGSIIAYVAPSRLVDEGKSMRAVALQNTTFSFGRFLGRDGDAHVGIEMDPYVTRIDPASLGKHTGTWFTFAKSQKHMSKSLQDGPWL